MVNKTLKLNNPTNVHLLKYIKYFVPVHIMIQSECSVNTNGSVPEYGENMHQENKYLI